MTAPSGQNPLPDVDRATLSAGLRKIRRRRWYLWALILVYLPLMWSALKFLPSMNAVCGVFGVWFAAVFVIAMIAAVARCPRCGNYFHVNGMTLLFLRKCLHCQLHVSADKRP